MSSKECDSFDQFIRRADGVLQEVGKAESVRHLRRSGAELLKAVVCGLDSAIHVLEPKHDPTKPAE